MTLDLVAHARALHREASATNERRVLVLAGDHDRRYAAVREVLDALPVGISSTRLVGPTDRLRCPHVLPESADSLLGSTLELVVFDASIDAQPNLFGTLSGVVDGGGLFIILIPPLETWRSQPDRFDRSMAVPPHETDAVSHHVRSRLIDLLEAHRGISIVELAEASTLTTSGLTDPAPRCSTSSEAHPSLATLPQAAVTHCRTSDQLAALGALEELIAPDDPQCVILEADRGRGKSSVAGIAAGGLLDRGERVLVTAPTRDAVDPLFERAGAMLEDLGRSFEVGPHSIDTIDGGRLTYLPPAAAVEEVSPATVVIADEAAGIAVPILEGLLAADRLVCATTVHGYEGTGRGFSIRFRDRLEEREHRITDVTLADPIRYGAGDPLEVWAFHALLLDASPAVPQLVETSTVESVSYERLTTDDLLADEHRLREVMGLLTQAHYRTEPNDLARVLDAPNLELRALCHDGHVVSVALLAHEGGLSPDQCSQIYEGERIRGHMIPDMLISHGRDEDAGHLQGVRIVRIATHEAVRSRGLGTHLLEALAEEFAEPVDWIGTGFGATPKLIRFWQQAGFGTITISTTRNERSGVYSVVMLAVTSEAGARLLTSHATRLRRRLPAICTDSLGAIHPPTLHAIVPSIPGTPSISLASNEWAILIGAAFGPGLIDVDPGPARRLLLAYLSLPVAERSLSESAERLLVRRLLLGESCETLAPACDYPSPGECRRAVGRALQPLVDRFAPADVRPMIDRFS